MTPTEPAATRPPSNEAKLTERQIREREYHRQHARENRALLDEPFDWDVIENPAARWWNGYWRMYGYIRGLNLKGQRVLVVGCGFGDDALRLARLGAEVWAADLSPESLEIAEALARREGVTVRFGVMAAESLQYPDHHFDMVLCRDILHHTDIPEALREIRRVAKPGGLFLVNEVYSHSLTNIIRHSPLVNKIIHPLAWRYIYLNSPKPYITQDERKLDEDEIRMIAATMREVEFERHFNFLAGRIFPARVPLTSMLDQILLFLLRPWGRLLAGRIILAGHFSE